jgi:TonB-linked SusC/RagA family outer membrane protein
MTIDKVQITLEGNQETLVSVFQKIESKTSFHFMYRNEDVKDIRNIRVASTRQTVEAFLKLVLLNTPLTYRQIDNRILITKVEEKIKIATTVINNVPERIYNSNNGTVRGQVKNDRGEPLTGVSIEVKGTSSATITDQGGNYALSVPDNATLVFTYIGFTTQEVPVQKKDLINVQLVAANNTMGEVIVIGYGTQRRSEITGAIASVSGKDIASVTSGGIQEALQGRAAGVNITPTSGQPGGALDMNIRGIATFGNGNPLFVIDGVPILTEGTSRNFNPLAAIPPDNIQSIQILKDASAAAIYGARAANGVVLVTTVRGRAGRNRTQVKVSRGVSTVTKFLPLMNTAQYIPYATEAYKNAGRAIPVSLQEPLLSKNLQTNTDWQREGFSDAPIQNYFFGTSGGSENATYSFSLGYLDEDGTLPQSGFKRYSVTRGTSPNKELSCQ